MLIYYEYEGTKLQHTCEYLVLWQGHDKNVNTI